MAGEPVQLRLIRPEDLLVLDLTLTNLALGDDGVLHVVDQVTPGRIVVGLPPQHIAEAAFQENETQNQVVRPLPVRSVAAAPSRLAFDVPADGPGIPFTVVGLLDWAGAAPRAGGERAPSRAPPRPRAGSAPIEPAADVTALELAYRLVLSPVGEHALAASLGAAHRRAASPSCGTPGSSAASRSPCGPSTGAGANPFLTSLSASDIADLVTLTGDFGNAVKSAE